MRKQVAKKQSASKKSNTDKHVTNDHAKILHLSGQIMQRNLEAYRNLAQ